MSLVKTKALLFPFASLISITLLTFILRTVKMKGSIITDYEKRIERNNNTVESNSFNNCLKDGNDMYNFFKCFSKNININENFNETEIEKGEIGEVKNVLNNVANVFENVELLFLMEDMLLKSLSVPVETQDFKSLKYKEESHTKLWNSVFDKHRTMDKNGNLVVSKEALIRYSDFLNSKDISSLPIKQKLLATVHQSLYPWVYGNRYKNFSDLISSFNGRGIVICTGDRHYNLVRSSIDIFRNVLNCTLPIEIFYIGYKDISTEHIDELLSIPDVYVNDIKTYFDNDIVNIGGWAVKSFALLASRFEEAILMDADAAYIRNPETLFEDQGYKELGTVYFRDRTREPGVNKGNRWLKSWMTDPLPETETSRFWNAISHHEMESSTVVMHKTRNILGLLNVCKLNEKKIRDEVVYKMVYGDKETFWIGFDMARQHYNMLPNPVIFVGDYAVGEAGKNKDLKQLCGHVGHMNREGQVLYWNDHIIKDKFNKYTKGQGGAMGQRLLHFDAYFIERGRNYWANPHCLNYEEANYGEKPINFTGIDREIIDRIIERENKYHYVLPLNELEEEEKEAKEMNEEEKKKEEEEKKKEEKKKEEEEKKKEEKKKE